MLSVNEGRQSVMELAPMLKGMPEERKLILKGIMIGINLGTADKKKVETEPGTQRTG